MATGCTIIAWTTRARSPGRRAGAFVTLAMLLAGAPLAPTARADVPLVWYAETVAGETVASRDADRPINPASVVKLATTLWALERLGAEHRFETRFGIVGGLDARTGVLDGDLVVVGGGDPDFHVENAMLVAEALRDAGLRTVRGAIVVDDSFWIGWEGGSERRQRDRERRARTMALRLRMALDPESWTDDTRTAWRRLAARRRLEGAPPRVAVRGGVRHATGVEPTRILATHRSNPLVRTLKRLNVYSNNDIERLEATLGPAEDLAAVLRARWRLAPASVRLETLSGLGSNRLPVRAIVRLLADLAHVAERQGVDVADLLAVSGCDSGTLRWLPGLARAPAGALAAKTGTLIVTDGGVVALAGYVYTTAATIRFAVAAPGAGRGVAEARQAVAHWLGDVVGRRGGFRELRCRARAGFSDDAAEIVSGR